MLWLCLYFPCLPLEIFSRAQADESPWVIAEGKGTRQQVVMCNGPAHASGIRPGMPLSAAHALAAGLRVRARDIAGERRALEALADWAGQFTSFVSPLPPQSLLLDIEGSLRLFGGTSSLLREIRRRLTPLGYRGETGIAPSPGGAALLARAGFKAPVTDPLALRDALANVPLSLMDLDGRQLRSLQGMGLRNLGDLLRLPRAGLARRLGPALSDYLDRITGERADPRKPWLAPDRFEHHLVLPLETADTEALLFPAHRLLLELEGFLRRRAAGTRRLDWTLSHDRASPTLLTLGLAAPNRDPGHLLGLMRERLAHVGLAHPITALGLRVHSIEPLSPKMPRLDGEREAPSDDWPLLVERLSARLGEGSVQGLRCLADHRPERAWGPCPPGASAPRVEADRIDGAPPPHRPLWLLPQPLALHSLGKNPDAPSLPQGGEPLSLLQGPECIESGWWDGHDAARDYYVASDTSQGRYWIFRERRPYRRGDRRGERCWFLHGYFA